MKPITADSVNQDYKRLCQILEVKYGARGKGLQQLVSSCEGLLSRPLVRKLRRVASIRNALFHNEAFTIDSVPDDFAAYCDRVATELEGPPHGLARSQNVSYSFGRRLKNPSHLVEPSPSGKKLITQTRLRRLESEAEAGVPQSRFELGSYMADAGRFIDAFVWLTLAGEQLDLARPQRAKILEHLSIEQIEAGNKRVAELKQRTMCSSSSDIE